MSVSSDLSVIPFSDSLKNIKIDLAVCGSIAAVESVKFIRSLRRLGALVCPWLSSGGSQFVTETSLSWAAASQAQTHFSGTRSHLACRDALIIAPASSSMIAKIAYGITDGPIAALAASYLGSKLPVFIVPTMHESMFNSPIFKDNINKLAPMVHLFLPEEEEGKRKFPDHEVLADEFSHYFNSKNLGCSEGVLVNMGSTKGYIDDIRYISNYSSGALGSAMVEEMYRHGLPSFVVAGDSTIKPKVFSSMSEVATNLEMLDECRSILDDRANSCVCAASVLDYIPLNKEKGKIRSNRGHIEVVMKQTDKIISQLKPRSGVKVGFKLEPFLNSDHGLHIAKEYIPKYDLSMLVVNEFSKVNAKRHSANLFELNENNVIFSHYVTGKKLVAKAVSAHVRKSIELKGTGSL